MNISLQEAVGRHYADFWNCTKRYRVCKGSRGSKKSKTAALNMIYRLLQFPESNGLCVRRYSNTLRDSVFSDLKWAIHRLGLDEYFDCTVSPMQITRRSTGQKILFRGLDDGLKITSISVDYGVLCFVWIEEAYEITNEDDFNKLDMSIRGEVPDGYFKQITLTFNPWSATSWLKARFFDAPDDDVFTKTTTWQHNEWLDEADHSIFLKMKEQNPRRYRIEGEGEWGIAEGLIYTNVDVADFNVDEVRGRQGVKSAFGLDFGYVNDPSALFCGLVDSVNKTIYVFDEMYGYGMSNEKIAERIASMGYAKEKIIADSAEPKSIDRLRMLGISRIAPARKGADSIKSGIDFISDFHIVIHPRCENFCIEIANYAWDTDRKTGVMLNRPIDEFNHLMDAMRYALEGFSRGATFSFD